MKVVVDSMPRTKKECLFSQAYSNRQSENSDYICKFLARKHVNEVFCTLSETGCPFLDRQMMLNGDV